MALDPDPRGDLHAGVIGAAVLNSVPRGGEAVQPWDLFPTIPRPRPRRQTAEEQRDTMIRWTLALGGKVNG